MSEEDALLSAIAAHPDEDTPRLMYADWLDEHGNPERAEFIRVQIELANQDAASDTTEVLKQRAYELESSHNQRWLAQFKPIKGFNGLGGYLYFDRGFPEILCISGDTPEDFAILRQLPGLRDLEFSHATLCPDILRDIAALQRLERLEFSRTFFEPDWLELLAPLPCWTCIRTDIYEGEWERAAGWSEFQERRISRVVDLPPDQQRLAAIRFVGGRPNRPVKALNWYKDRVTDSELRLLRYLPELEEVTIHQGRETAEGLRHLYHLPNLKKFVISDTECESLVPIMNCTTLEHLEYHTLGADFGDKAVVGLDRLTNLRHLELCPERNGALRDATLHRIGALRELRSLRIELGALEDERSLAALANLTKLESLSIEGRIEYDEYTGDELRRFLANLRR